MQLPYLNYLRHPGRRRRNRLNNLFCKFLVIFVFALPVISCFFLFLGKPANIPIQLVDLFGIISLSLIVFAVSTGVAPTLLEKIFGLQLLMKMHRKSVLVFFLFLFAHILTMFWTPHINKEWNKFFKLFYDVTDGVHVVIARYFSLVLVIICIMAVYRQLPRQRLGIPWIVWKVAHYFVYPLSLGICLHALYFAFTHSGLGIIATDDTTPFYPILHVVVVGYLLLIWLVSVLDSVRRMLPCRCISGGRNDPHWIVTDSYWISERMFSIVLHHPQRPSKQMERRQAGQFVRIRVKTQKKWLSPNYFTIASAPTDEDLQFIVRRGNGNFTRQMDFLAEPGTTVLVDGPFGTNLPDLEDENAGEVVVIVTESGFAFLLSLLRHALLLHLHNRLKARLRCLVSVLNGREMVCPMEVKQIIDTLSFKERRKEKEGREGREGREGKEGRSREREREREKERERERESMATTGNMMKLDDSRSRSKMNIAKRTKRSETFDERRLLGERIRREDILRGEQNQKTELNDNNFIEKSDVSLPKEKMFTPRDDTKSLLEPIVYEEREVDQMKRKEIDGREEEGEEGKEEEEERRKEGEGEKGKKEGKEKDEAEKEADECIKREIEQNICLSSKEEEQKIAIETEVCHQKEECNDNDYNNNNEDNSNYINNKDNNNNNNSSSRYFIDSASESSGYSPFGSVGSIQDEQIAPSGKRRRKESKRGRRNEIGKMGEKEKRRREQEREQMREKEREREREKEREREREREIQAEVGFGASEGEGITDPFLPRQGRQHNSYCTTESASASSMPPPPMYLSQSSRHLGSPSRHYQQQEQQQKQHNHRFQQQQQKEYQKEYRDGRDYKEYQECHDYKDYKGYPDYNDYQSQQRLQGSSLFQVADESNAAECGREEQESNKCIIRYSILFREDRALYEVKHEKIMKQWIPSSFFSYLYEGALTSNILLKLIDDPSTCSVYTRGDTVVIKSAESLLKLPPLSVSPRHIHSQSHVM